MAEAITNEIIQEETSRILRQAQHEAQENAAINFRGFYLGMSAQDASILALSYGLTTNDWQYALSESSEDVKAFLFSLIGIKRITKGGNTYDGLLTTVRSDLKMPESEYPTTEIKTICKQIARISEDDGLRIYYEHDGDPAKSVAGRVWESSKRSAKEADELDLLGGLLLLNALF